MLVTNNDIKSNKQKFNEIEEKLENIREDMIKDFRKHENNNRPVDLNNPDDVRRLNNYVNKRARKYELKYKKVLKPYKIKVKFIR